MRTLFGLLARGTGLFLSVLLILAAGAAVAAAGPPPNRLPVAPTPWGACGVFTEEKKVVRTFANNMVLHCGGPRLSSDPRWGYRHIIKSHRDDFKRLAGSGLTNRNWMDLADFVIQWTIIDPL